MNRNEEKGFALVLSLILLITMSLMGGSLIVVSSGDHQNNNSSDQYQQAFYVAETGLMQGEKWVIDNYLGHWINTIPSADAALNQGEDETDDEFNARKEQYTEASATYHRYSNSMYRHSFNRGPARNDTEITEDNKSVCMKSFRNLSTADTIRIAGGGTLPKSDNFINIVGPILLSDGPYTSSENFITTHLSDTEDEEIAEKEVKHLRRFEYEFFVMNVGNAAYRAEGSSIATNTSNVDAQGTAYKIYACGIFYGKGDDDNPNDGNVQLIIPLENLIVMPN
jgi:Tfp pilus assembly protein PilX